MMTTRCGDNEVDSQQEPANDDANENENTAIIINPAGTDHGVPIAGVATDQYKTVIDTAADGKVRQTPSPQDWQISQEWQNP